MSLHLSHVTVKTFSHLHLSHLAMDPRKRALAHKTYCHRMELASMEVIQKCFLTLIPHLNSMWEKDTMRQAPSASFNFYVYGSNILSQSQRASHAWPLELFSLWVWVWVCHIVVCLAARMESNCESGLEDFNFRLGWVAYILQSW